MIKDIRILKESGVLLVLSIDQSLALRVDLLQSKDHYQKQYNFLKHNSLNVLQPPSALDSLESSFLLNNVSFDLINPEGDVDLTQNSSKTE